MEFILKAKTTIPRIESNSFLWVAPSMGGSLQMSCIKRKMLILCKATSMRSLMWGSLNPLVCIYIYTYRNGAILCGRKSSLSRVLIIARP